MVGLTWAYVKGQFRASLVWPRHEAMKDRDFIDEPEAERGKVVGTVFTSRENHELEIRVAPESPDDIGRRYPAFTDSSEGFDAFTPRAVLKIRSNRKLDRGRLWET
jgi:hypothetical protein